MLNFASLFNQYRQQSNSGLNELLEQPDITMGKVLDQDSFQGEYKSNNPKVTSFMTYQRFKELLDFVTVVPGPEDKKRAYKYPLAACQLLSIDVQNTIDFFLPESPIIITQTISELEQVEVEVQIEDSSQTPQQISDQISPVEPKKENTVTESGNEVKQPSESEKQTLEKEKNEKDDDKVQILGEEEKELPKEGLSEQNKVEKLKEDEKAKKKVIKKQMKMVQKTKQKQVPPLIHQLLSYFKGQINYTLAGYVSKILSQFFNKRPSELCKYLFEQEMIEMILNHAESRSVGDFLVKILTYESTLCMAQRSILFKSMLKRLAVPSQITTMSNLSAYACEVIEKVTANLKSNNKIPEFSTAYLSLETIRTLINSVISSEQSVSVYNAPVLLSYLTTVSFTIPEDQQIINDFTALLTSFVDKSCKKLTVKSSNLPKLGVGRVKIVEILKHIIKEDVLNTREIVARKEDFFPTLYNLMLEYELNNLLHNQIIKILEVALEESEGSLLNIAILKDSHLLNLIVSEAKQDSKIIKGNSTYKHRKGYIAHLINLCLKLKELSSKNSKIQELTQNSEFKKIFEGLIEKEIYNTKQSLAGYAMKKEMKHEILFQKQDILSAHVTFFQKCPPAVFDQEPDHLTNDHINIEHPDLLQELQKQLEENLNVKEEKKMKEESQSEEKAEEKKEKDEKGEKKENVKTAEPLDQSHYWVVHLDYDVDSLLVDI